MLLPRRRGTHPWQDPNESRGNKCVQVPPGCSSSSRVTGSTCTHHAVVVDQLQLVVGQNVAPVVHQVQRHLRRGHARLAAGPASAHGEQGADVQLLLSCGRPWPEEEQGDERQPQEPRRSRGTLEKERHVWRCRRAAAERSLGLRQLGMKDVNTCPAPLSSLDACAGSYCVIRPFTLRKSVCFARRLNILALI